MASKGFKRKLTAVFSADAVGYSRLMGEDEESTIKMLEDYKGVMFTLIKQHQGRVVDSTGDNLLAEFGSVVEAVQCAVAVQKELQARNADLPENHRMQFRIGINLGDVIEEEERLYGDGVNIAARLESLAEPGGICISKTAFDHIESKLPLGYQFLGEQTVKNIAKPVGAYKVLLETRVIDKEERKEAKTTPLWRRKAVLSVGIIVILAVIAALYWNLNLRRPLQEPASDERIAFPLPDKPSIAVLPFVNMSGDPEQEYFSDGITEDLITDLSKVAGLFVIARNSVFTYKGKAVKISDVGGELGVRYVLEGSVRKSGDRVRITAQLIDAATSGHIWAERYDRELKDIFELQDEVTQEIVSILAVKLTEDEQKRLVHRGTDNLEAYDYILRGLEYFYRYTKESNSRARKMFERSIELDPQYALAYSLIGYTYTQEWTFGWSQSFSVLDIASDLAQKALAQDDSQPEGHALLSEIYLWKKQHSNSIAEINKALAIDPNDADGLATLAGILNWAGQPGEAIEVVTRAIDLNPKYPAWYLWNLGHAYFLMERHEEAIETMRKVIDHNPNFLPAYAFLAASYVEQNKVEHAQTEAGELERLSPFISLEDWRKRLPYKNEDALVRLFNALRELGLG